MSNNPTRNATQLEPTGNPLALATQPYPAPTPHDPIGREGP